MGCIRNAKAGCTNAKQITNLETDNLLLIKINTPINISLVVRKKLSFDWPVINRRLPLVNQRKCYLAGWRFKWRNLPII